MPTRAGQRSSHSLDRPPISHSTYWFRSNGTSLSRVMRCVSEPGCYVRLDLRDAGGVALRRFGRWASLQRPINFKRGVVIVSGASLPLRSRADQGDECRHGDRRCHGGCGSARARCIGLLGRVSASLDPRHQRSRHLHCREPARRRGVLRRHCRSGALGRCLHLACWSTDPDRSL